jgi:hypothetical protein
MEKEIYKVLYEDVPIINAHESLQSKHIKKHNSLHWRTRSCQLIISALCILYIVPIILIAKPVHLLK